MTTDFLKSLAIGWYKEATHLPGLWLKQHKPIRPSGLLPFNPRALGFHLYLPYCVTQSDCPALPLLVMLHGCNQNAQQFAAGTRMNEYAERYGFAVLYPEQNRLRNLHNCWNWFKPPKTGSSAVEANDIIHTVQTLLSFHALDASHCFLAGMSAGAAMAAFLSLYYGTSFQGLALHSAPFIMQKNYHATEALDTMKHGWQGDINTLKTPETYQQNPLPTLIMQGLQDQVVNPLNATQLYQWFVQMNHHSERIQQEARDTTATTDTAASKKVQLLTIPSLGHAWANGDPQFKYNQACMQDASLQIIRFFGLDKTATHDEY